MSRLADILRRTPAKVVTVKFDQVAEIIGEELAHSDSGIALAVTGNSQIRTRHNSPRSAIPASKRIIKDRMATYDRAELLEALEAAEGPSTESPSKVKGVPNPALLSTRKIKELQDSGELPK